MPAEKAKKDWKAALGPDEFVGQVEVQARWPEGYGAMTVADGGVRSSRRVQSQRFSLLAASRQAEACGHRQYAGRFGFVSRRISRIAAGPPC